MRFSHFLKYNSVPEWNSHYMNYNELKNLIYTLQTDELKMAGGENSPASGMGDYPALGPPDAKLPKRLAQRLESKLFSRKDRTNDAGSPVKGKQSRATDNPFATEDVVTDDVDPKGRKNDNLATEETIELQSLRDLEASPRLTRQRTPVRDDSNGSSDNNGSGSPTGKLFGPFKKVFESRRSSESSEGETLSSTYDTFMANLTAEKIKVDDFYKRMEAKFYDRYDNLEKDLINLRVINGVTSSSGASVQSSAAVSNMKNAVSITEQITDEEAEDEDDIVENDEFSDPENTALLDYSQFNIRSQKRSILKKTTMNLYIDLSQLKGFIELNKMGFSKITKKADKVLHLHIKTDLIQTEEFFKDTYIFQKETLNRLSERMDKLIEYFSIITPTPTLQIAKDELRSYLHDHIVWERSNTWKDMLGLLSHDDKITTELEDNDPDATLRAKLKMEYIRFNLPEGMYNAKFFPFRRLMIPKLFFTIRALKIAIIITITDVLLGVKTFNDPAEHRCMALVECVAFLWATESLPLHITGFLVPFLVVLFRVLKDKDGNIMDAASASSEIFSAMWSGTIVILLAGFTIGEALSQYNIARIFASWLLAAAGTKPRNVILVAMAVVFFLSMWISNVASPVLTYSLLTPVLDELDCDNAFAKALILGVAFSADIGGMPSPISSPQNIISMGYLRSFGVGWGQFFAIALPVGIITTLAIWVFLCLTFKINSVKLKKFEPIRTRFKMKQYYIIFVSVLTILLWCVESKIQNVFGSSGVIAIIPIVAFFGTGLLSTKDFNSFPWSIVMLAMGGMALGHGVSSSGLLVTVAKALQKKIMRDSPMAVLCIFGILMLVIGTFVSHTVSAIIVVPLVKEIGLNLSQPKAAPILVFGCALLASGGMGLASSGFPNVTAISKIDKKGNRYLSMGTFISRGVPSSLICYLVVITIGYGIMSSVLPPVKTST